LIDLAIFISSKTEVVAGESFGRLVTCFLVILQRSHDCPDS
jgi:hypothetical protein